MMFADGVALCTNTREKAATRLKDWTDVFYIRGQNISRKKTECTGVGVKTKGSIRLEEGRGGPKRYRI